MADLIKQVVDILPILIPFLLGIIAGLPAAFLVIRKFLNNLILAFEDGKIDLDELIIILRDATEVFKVIGNILDKIFKRK
jgi:hypothetical protein